MKNVTRQFRNGLPKRQSGFVLTTELVLLCTVLVLGTVLGLTLVRDAISGELIDLANVIESRASTYYAFDGYPDSDMSAERRQVYIDAGAYEGETLEGVVD